MADPADDTIGGRIKRFREEAGLTATELAAQAGIAKSYLSALESGDAHSRRPSGETMYSLAEVLGVAMSDLLGRPILHTPNSERPPSLIEFAAENDIPESDVEMLASIRFRGEQPQTAKRWEFIYEAIRNSRGMDSKH
jgi:transcriptional regulator with XRE-family HTH domain